MSDSQEFPPALARGGWINSYYIGFTATGVHEVDTLLYRVCRAGKMYHSTEGWSDPPFDDPDGPSENDKIQCAADESAAQIRARDQRITELEAELDARKRLTEGHQGLLAAYRTNGTPTQKTMRTIDRAKADLAALEDTDG